jgi:drug/metabolite transporter (DMT)-like permease
VGGNNTGTKLIVATWPPIWTGASRFFCAGLLLHAMLRWTSWLGEASLAPRDLQRALWWRGGLTLAAYIVSFNWAVRFTPVSHVAVYLGAAPVWALLWEGLPSKQWSSFRRYVAAALAFSGVLVLSWPALKGTTGSWPGELLGLIASVLWPIYGGQCRRFRAALSGAEISAQTMWRAGVLLAPLALVELWQRPLSWRADLVIVQAYCIVAGGVGAFGIWNHALRYWPTSQVLLFNNLVPISTMTWAHFWLGEPITPTFWLAMFLVIGGVLLAQVNWKVMRDASP